MLRCPTCKRSLSRVSAEEAARFAPFCSQRCKLADLHGWLSGSYVISEALPFDESEGRPPTPPNEDA